MILLMNELPDFLHTRDGLKLSLRHWPATDQDATRGVVCIVHGLGEHIGRYDRLANTLSNWGWSVVGYDQRGHGKSAGARGVLHQNDDLLHDLASVLDTIGPLVANQKLVLLGHSLGGLLVARFVAALSDPNENSQWRRPVDLCVLSSPALALQLSLAQKFLLKTLGKFMPNLALRNGLKPEWLCTDTDVVKAFRSDKLVHNRVSVRLACFMLESAEFVQLRAAMWKTPTLLLYSGIDCCVSPIGSERFALAAPKSMVETRVYENLKHEILNEPVTAGVYSAIENWLRTFVSNAANGANEKIGRTRSPDNE